MVRTLFYNILFKHDFHVLYFTLSDYSFVLAVNIEHHFSFAEIWEKFVFKISDCLDTSFFFTQKLIQKIGQQVFVGVLSEKPLESEIREGIDLAFFCHGLYPPKNTENYRKLRYILIL